MLAPIEIRSRCVVRPDRAPCLERHAHMRMGLCDNLLTDLSLLTCHILGYQQAGLHVYCAKVCLGLLPFPLWIRCRCMSIVRVAAGSQPGRSDRLLPALESCCAY